MAEAEKELPNAGAPPGSSPAVAPQESAAPSKAPAATASLETPAAVVEPKIELTSDKPSLLETFDKATKPAVEPKIDAAKPEPAKPAEAVKPEGDKPAAETKPAEVKPAEEAPKAEPEKPAEPVKYEFELPPVLKGDDTKIGLFSGILNEAKLDATLGKDVGQKLLGLHADAMTAYADQLAKDKLAQQHKAFNDTRDGWNTQVMADPEIGGSGHDTAMKAIARVRDRLVSSSAPGTDQYTKDYAELETFLRITGAGDHPVFLKMMHRAAPFIDEPQADTIPHGYQPPKGNGRAPKGGIYTHPSSANMDK